MINFLKEAKLIEHELIKIRRDFHTNPELSFKEVRTSLIIKKFLAENGIEFFETANTGICANIKGSLDGSSRVIAIRADMDALPINEITECDYKSKNSGVMHACGHDCHMAILLGTTKILSEHKSDFSGYVKILFEPGEETYGGATDMIKDGVLENPKVDYIIGLHVDPEVDCGKIMIKNSVVNAASNPFEAVIHGSGGHGASPNKSIDPITITSNIIMSLQTIISREISPFEPSVVTVGSIHGGNAENVIPSSVKITGMIRTMNNEDRKFVCNRVKEIICGISKSFRGDADVLIRESYPCLYNDDTVVRNIIKNASEILGKQNVLLQQYPKMYVESFAYFAQKVPSGFYFLGCRNLEKGINKPLHSDLFNVDERCLAVGCAIQSSTAFNYLKNGFI